MTGLRKVKAGATASATALLLAMIVFGTTLSAESPATPAAAPSIKLQSIDGQTYDVASLRGNVVLVSFGATWCTPCTTELRALEELKREYGARPVKFFWISIESQEDISDSKLKHYAKERRITFPVLRDPARAAYLQFSTRVRLPTIVFFAKNGDVDAPVQFGIRSPADSYKGDIRARLDKLLAE